MKRASIIVCFVCCVGLQVAKAAETDDLHPYLESGFSLDLGMFFPDRHLDLSVNGSIADINDEIDFDKGLKLGSADSTFAAELSWRFRDKWSIVGQFFKSSDSGRLVLEEDIEWGDVVFGAGSFASVGTEFSLTRIFFGRQFNTSRRHDIGIGGGIHWLHIGTFVEGEILVNGVPAGARRSVSVEAPLPNLGAWYMYSISSRWALRSRLDLFGADIGDYKGLLVNASLGVNFQAFEHFGIGLNYNYFELDVSIDKSGWRGNFETVYDGVYVYASYYY
jgi:hypothetical protein